MIGETNVFGTNTQKDNNMDKLYNEAISLYKALEVSDSDILTYIYKSSFL